MELNTQIERWMPITGFEDLYEISDHGIVRTFRMGNSTKELGIKAPGLAAAGYHQVQLTRLDKTRSCFYVHRLVAIHFIPNTENLPEINHKDGDKLNNHISNLEWSTRRGNMAHAWATGLRKPLIDVRRVKEMRASGLTLKAVADHFKISQAYVSKIARDKIKMYITPYN